MSNETKPDTQGLIEKKIRGNLEKLQEMDIDSDWEIESISQPIPIETSGNNNIWDAEVIIMNTETRDRASCRYHVAIFDNKEAYFTYMSAWRAHTT